jgi:hypothetical protein
VAVPGALLGDRALRRVNGISACLSCDLEQTRQLHHQPRVCSTAGRTLRHLRAFRTGTEAAKTRLFEFVAQLDHSPQRSGQLSADLPLRTSVPESGQSRTPQAVRRRAGLLAAPAALSLSAESTGPYSPSAPAAGELWECAQPQVGLSDRARSAQPTGPAESSALTISPGVGRRRRPRTGAESARRSPNMA